MCREVENPMVIDAHWRHLERAPQVVGECAGCEEDIYTHEQWLEMELQGHDFLVHQDKECTYQFVSGMSVCRGGEE
jgi:extradiol dioxygenase family protein